MANIIKKGFKSLIEKIYLSFSDNKVFIDELTQCHNKNYLELYCYKKFNNKELIVALVDANNLKAINDQCGHTAGDLYLIGISKKLNNYGDVIRFGGDEFLIFIDPKKLEEFKKFADEDFTIAYGIFNKKENDSLSKAIEIADNNMYQNKKLHKKLLLNNTKFQSNLLYSISKSKNEERKYQIVKKDEKYFEKNKNRHYDMNELFDEDSFDK